MSDPQPPVIQVIMTAGIQEAFKAWLVSRGLYLFPIPVEDDLPTFGIGVALGRELRDLETGKPAQ